MFTKCFTTTYSVRLLPIPYIVVYLYRITTYSFILRNTTEYYGILRNTTDFLWKLRIFYRNRKITIYLSINTLYPKYHPYNIIWTILNHTESYWVILSHIIYVWIILNHTESYWVILYMSESDSNLTWPVFYFQIFFLNQKQNQNLYKPNQTQILYRRNQDLSRVFMNQNLRISVGISVDVFW